MTTYSQPGIFNALDVWDMDLGHGMLIDDPTDGVNNAIALQATINAALSQNGGIVLIPATDATLASGSYKLQFTESLQTISINPAYYGYSPQPLLICGTGNATRLLVESESTVFTIVGNDDTTFQDLILQWDQANGIQTGSGFLFTPGAGTTAEGYRLFRVNVVDCQYPVTFNDGNLATMLECSLQYTEAYPTSQTTTGIAIGGATQLAIESCALELFTPYSDTIGISIYNGTASTTIGYPTIRDTYISTFETGIAVATNTGANIQSPMFTNVTILTPGTGIDIQGESVFDATFVNCQVLAMTGSTGPAVIIGTAGQPNQWVDTVRFVSCTVAGFVGYGLEIAQGRNIQVVGGSFSGNGYDAGAGIAITGAAAEVQINGVSCLGPSEASAFTQQYGIEISAGQDIQVLAADCSGTGSSEYPGVGILVNANSYGPPSDVRIIGATCAGGVFGGDSEQIDGVSISGNAANVYVEDCTLTGSLTGGYGINIAGATGVFVTDCDCSGNPYGLAVTNDNKNVYISGCNLNGCASGALYASSPGTLQVVNCPGYNDQGTVLHGTPGSDETFNPTRFSYYGPIEFYVMGTSMAPVTAIAIDGNTTYLISGGFTLNAPAPNGSSYVGETAKIIYGGGGTVFPHFLVVGH